MEDMDESIMLKGGLYEVERLVNYMKLDMKYVPLFQKKLVRYREILERHPLFRDHFRLAPLIIYLYFWFRGKIINKNKLLSVAHISKKSFEAFISQIIRYDEQHTN